MNCNSHPSLSTFHPFLHPATTSTYSFPPHRIPRFQDSNSNSNSNSNKPDCLLLLDLFPFPPFPSFLLLGVTWTCVDLNTRWPYFLYFLPRNCSFGNLFLAFLFLVFFSLGSWSMVHGSIFWYISISIVFTIFFFSYCTGDSYLFFFSFLHTYIFRNDKKTGWIMNMRVHTYRYIHIYTHTLTRPLPTIFDSASAKQPRCVVSRERIELQVVHLAHADIGCVLHHNLTREAAKSR